MLALACVLLACDPDAKNLGEDLATDGADDWTVDWRVESAPETLFLDIEPTTDGGVLVVGRNGLEDQNFIRRYAADGSLVWTVGTQVINGGRVTSAGSAIFLAAEAHVAGTSGGRASLQRLSSTGLVEYEYVHARDGNSNTFSFDVVASADEVALLIGNWGEAAYEGEPWFEVQRLDHELQPIAEPIGFDERVEQIAYDTSGELVILETPEQGLARVHRPSSGATPALVDCASLLTSSGAPLCVNNRPDFRLTNYETGVVRELGSLDLEGVSAAHSTSIDSTILGAPADGGGLLQIVEVFEDGSQGRRAQIPSGDSSMGGGPISVRQLPNGAVYVIAVEAVQSDLCSDSDGVCPRSHLLRMATDE